MVEVVAAEAFEEWYTTLGDDDAEAVNRYVDLLEVQGVTLGHPYSSSIAGASFALRELRVQAKGDPIRVFYAFDPERQAVLLLGGNKKGISDRRFYAEYIPRAERLWDEYLADVSST